MSTRIEALPGLFADLDDEGEAIRVIFHVPAGHVAGADRTHLADAVLDETEALGRRELHASVPLGEAEILDRMRRRGATRTRAAGATCLVDVWLEQGTLEQGTLEQGA